MFGGRIAARGFHDMCVINSRNFIDILRSKPSLWSLQTAP